MASGSSTTRRHRRRGVLFVRYTDDQRPTVAKTNGKLEVKVTDPSLT
jgi:hypothetical protein